MRILFFLSSILIFSCKNAKQIVQSNSKAHILYQGRYFLGVQLCTCNYRLEIPINGKVTKMPPNSLGDTNSSEYRVSYQDSSIIYIGDNTLQGSRLNYANRFLSKNKIMYSGIPTDSFNIEGIQNNGKYWKETVLGNVYVGYYNVDSQKLISYKKYLKTLIIDSTHPGNCHY